MKKILALTLAAVMAAGMTTVAFAKDDNDITSLEFTGTVYYDKDGDGVIDSDEKDSVARGSSDEKTGTLGEGVITGGTELYFELKASYENAEEAAGYTAVEKLKDVKSWEVETDWTVEDDEVDKPEFVQKKIGNEYGIYLKLVLPENDTVNNRDLVGTIGLGDTRSDAKDAWGNYLVNIALSYGRDKTNVTGNTDIKSFEGSFPEAYETKGAVVDFDDVDDVIDIEFNDMALFTVDVTGQGKLDLRFNTKFDPEVADRYE